MLSSSPRAPPSQLSTSPLSAAGGSSSGRQQRVQFSHYNTGIPPPIASVVLSPVRSSTSQSRLFPTRRTSSTQAIPVHDNPLSVLTRTEKALQAELQELLDAQSAGLVQGRSGGFGEGEDGASETGSSTPTGRSNSRSDDGSRRRRKDDTRIVMPVRQPRKKKLSLRGARRGILGTMEELGAVKEHEAEILQVEKRNLEQSLKQVQRWEKKIVGFEEVMNKLSHGAQGSEEMELKTEKSAVETEIRELEDRMLQLQARDRLLESRIRELGNRREAEISSFREGKREIERVVGEWLRRPGVRDVTSMLGGLSLPSAGGSENGSTSRHEDPATSDGNDMIPFLTLPPQRRTLPMASSWLTSSLHALDSSLNAISHEHEALLAGSELWAETVALVSDFEEGLRKQMKEDAKQGRQLGTEDLRAQLRKMEDVTVKLEQKEAVAVREGWNLLICAVGAEVEAFREGEALLRGVLRTVDPEFKENAGNVHGDLEDDREDSFLTAPLSSEEGQEQGQNGPGNEHEEELGGLDQDTHKVEVEGLQDLSMSKREDNNQVEQRKYRDASPSRSESEDDGPPQALLVGLEEDRDGDEML